LDRLLQSTLQPFEALRSHLLHKLSSALHDKRAVSEQLTQRLTALDALLIGKIKHTLSEINERHAVVRRAKLSIAEKKRCRCSSLPYVMQALYGCHLLLVWDVLWWNALSREISRLTDEISDLERDVRDQSVAVAKEQRDLSKYRDAAQREWLALDARRHNELAVEHELAALHSHLTASGEEWMPVAALRALQAAVAAEAASPSTSASASNSASSTSSAAIAATPTPSSAPASAAAAASSTSPAAAAPAVPTAIISPSGSTAPMSDDEPICMS
jgi:hypothetical protein